MVHAVIFDFDLTLVDSATGVCGNLNALAAEKGLRSLDIAEVRPTIGMALVDAMEKFWGPLKSDWLPRYRELFALRHYQGIVPFPQTIPALTRLRENGIKLAVASNRLDPEGVVQASGLKAFFPVVVGIEGINPKPNPAVLFRAMELLGVISEQTLYCGDSDIDMLTAVNGRLRGIGVASGNFSCHKLEEAGAFRSIQNLSELPDLVRGL